MKDFSRGVCWYTKGTVEIGMPEDDICCHWCPLMGMDTKMDRAWCRKTGELLVAPKHFVGVNCPIIFDDEMSEEISDG